MIFLWNALVYFNEGSVLLNDRSYLRNQTIDILGGTQQPENQSSEPATTSEPSRWEKFKAKVKSAWNTVMKVAEDIREKIMPIINGVGNFLANWAIFCNRNPNKQRSVQHRYYNQPIY